MTSDPENPPPIRALAAMTWTLYAELVHEGFTIEQALELCKAVILTMINTQSKSNV